MAFRVLQVVVLLNTFHQHRWRERPVGFSELDLCVDDVLHVCAARIGENAAVAEGPRAPFESPLKPTDYLPLLKRVDHAIDEAIVILDVLMADAVRVEESLDVSLRVVLSEVRVLHDVLPRMAKDGMIDIQRCADGPSSVPCRRLDIQLFERSLPEDPTVRHAVQCDTAGHA